MEENPQRRAHTSNLPPKLCGAAQSAASPADRCALLPGPPAAKGKLMSAAGAFSFAPGRPPNPSVPKRRGEPRLADTCGRGPADPQEPGRRASRWQDRDCRGSSGGGTRGDSLLGIFLLEGTAPSKADVRVCRPSSLASAQRHAEHSPEIRQQGREQQPIFKTTSQPPRSLSVPSRVAHGSQRCCALQ
uniref:Uncharacterized protein n=1 Tax=Rousettus aegyptiacus TaxID=9407 RepID=A0A7J8CHU1_ROUAE|nr:hypothetical protein HJG63_008991 [Rousettus aegyptiacus]